MCDEVDCEAEVTEAPRTAYSVKVGLRGLGEIEVDDYVDCLDVNTSGEKIWRIQRGKITVSNGKVKLQGFPKITKSCNHFPKIVYTDQC